MIATLQGSPAPTDSTADVQRTIVEDLRCLDDWTERCRYLIALPLEVCSGRAPDELLAATPAVIEETGLEQHLSANRNNGLFPMLARIQALAAAHGSGYRAGAIA